MDTDPTKERPPRRNRWKDFWDRLSALVLVLAAVVGLAYPLIGPGGFIPLIKDPQVALLYILSILCGGVGAQRLIHMQDISDCTTRIDDRTRDMQQNLGTMKAEIVELLDGIGENEDYVKDAVDHLNSAEILIGPKAIESAAIELVKSSDDNDSLKATAQYFSEHLTEGGMSEGYFTVIASRVAASKIEGGGMTYRVILPAEPGPVRDLAIAKRMDIFKREQVEDRIRIRYSKTSWPIEVLICGKGMILAFSGHDSLKYNFGVRITDRSFLASAKEWFLESAWNNAEERIRTETTNPRKRPSDLRDTGSSRTSSRIAS